MMVATLATGVPMWPDVAHSSFDWLPLLLSLSALVVAPTIFGIRLTTASVICLVVGGTFGGLAGGLDSGSSRRSRSVSSASRSPRSGCAGDQPTDPDRCLTRPSAMWPHTSEACLGLVGGESLGAGTQGRFRHLPGGREEYFQKRGLRRHAGVWSLWALGVAAVISGDFFGWNLGLLTGGFGGLAIATVFITVDVHRARATASPRCRRRCRTRAAPTRSDARRWGRGAGSSPGSPRTWSTSSRRRSSSVAIGFYMNAITIELFDLDIPLQIWWAIFYVIFLGINIAGIETTMRFTVVICFLSLAILAFFFIAALTDFSVDHLTNIPPEAGNSEWLPFGISGIFKNLPFAIWFYLAIEELPLAAEESMDPRRDIPKATMWGLWTLRDLRRRHLILNTGTSSGAAGIGATARAPVPRASRTSSEQGTAAALLALIAVVGLVASFHTIIFAYGRNIFSLSRAGYFPKCLSMTHGTRKTPYVALLAGRRGRLRASHGGSTSRPGPTLAHRCLRWRSSAPSSPTSCRCSRSSCCAGSCRTSSARTGVRSGCGARRSPASSRWSRSSRCTSTTPIGRASYGTAIWFVLGILYFAIAGGTAGAVARGGVRAHAR